MSNYRSTTVVVGGSENIFQNNSKQNIDDRLSIPKSAQLTADIKDGSHFKEKI